MACDRGYNGTIMGYNEHLFAMLENRFEPTVGHASL